MPIIISRKTGQIISMPDYTQEQKDKAWEIIFEKNAEKIVEKILMEPEKSAALQCEKAKE